MSTIAASRQDILRANRRLYDAVGTDYENIDGRRDDDLLAWIRGTLVDLAQRHGNDVLLDLGAGSGVVSRAARGVFNRIFAIDLSPRMLASIHAGPTMRLAADADFLPLRDGTVNVMACFAVLHHLPDSRHLAIEAARVLRPGGAFWSDHDIELQFCRRFKWPLALYRNLRGANQQYTEKGADLSVQDYELAECRESGVDAIATRSDFEAAGLNVNCNYHWFGLTRPTNRIFARRHFGRGWAPLLRVTATKGEQD